MKSEVELPCTYNRFVQSINFIVTNVSVLQDRVVIRSRLVNTRVFDNGKNTVVCVCVCVTWLINIGSLNRVLLVYSTNTATLAYSLFTSHTNKIKPVTFSFCKYVTSSISGALAATDADTRILSLTCLSVPLSFCLYITFSLLYFLLFVFLFIS